MLCLHSNIGFERIIVCISTMIYANDLYIIPSGNEHLTPTTNPKLIICFICGLFCLHHSSVFINLRSACPFCGTGRTEEATARGSLRGNSFHKHTRERAVAASPWRCTLVGNVFQIGAVCAGMMDRLTDGQESAPWATGLLLTAQPCQTPQPSSISRASAPPPPFPRPILSRLAQLILTSLPSITLIEPFLPSFFLLLLNVLRRGLVDCQTGA